MRNQAAFFHYCSSSSYGDLRCMGTRQLLEFEETEKDGKSLQQLTLGDYEFDTFYQVCAFACCKLAVRRAFICQVDEKVNAAIRGLKSSYKLKKGDNVVIFAETRAEWMQTALACFKCGFPVSANVIKVGAWYANK